MLSGINVKTDVGRLNLIKGKMAFAQRLFVISLAGVHENHRRWVDERPVAYSQAMESSDFESIDLSVHEFLLGPAAWHGATNPEIAGPSEVRRRLDRRSRTASRMTAFHALDPVRGEPAPCPLDPHRFWRTNRLGRTFPH
jgi:hypothetical protein